MSIEYCDYCDRYIDTDFDAEHFDCVVGYRCIEEALEGVDEIPQFEGTQEQLDALTIIKK